MKIVSAGGFGVVAGGCVVVVAVVVLVLMLVVAVVVAVVVVVSAASSLSSQPDPTLFQLRVSPLIVPKSRRTSLEAHGRLGMVVLFEEKMEGRWQV